MNLQTAFLAALILPWNAYSQVTTGNWTSSIPEYDLDEYGNSYRLQADLAVRNLTQRELEDVRDGLRRVVFDAFQRSTSRRLMPEKWRYPTQTSTLFGAVPPANETNPFDVQILRAQQRPEGHIRVEFIVRLKNGVPVPSQVVVEDLSLLTLSHISAILHYPVTKIASEYDVQRSIQSSWWIVAIFIGSALLLVLCCWAALFLYYNTCGRPLPDLKPVEQISTAVRDAKRIAHRKTQTDQAYLVDEAPELVLERHKKSTTSSGKSQRRIASEERPSAVATMRGYGSDDDVKGSPRNPSVDATEDAKRETPDNIEEYEGELSDESPEQLVDQSLRREGSGFSHLSVGSRRGSVRLERPKSALPRRPIRTLEGEVIGSHPSMQRWSPYDAGDAVAAIYAIGPALSSYPTPLPSTATGVLELTVSDPFKQIL